jgi:type 1 glutamine amidotransferase
MIRRAFLSISVAASLALAASTATRKALIIDGRNNHDWKATTPVLKRLLEETRLFDVDVATAPADNDGLQSFHPKFSDYAVVVLNYNDFGPQNAGAWPQATQDDFLAYVKNGGGIVSYHAADNAFPQWGDFNKVIGVGGWGGRKPGGGIVMMRWRDGKAVRDETPRNCGNHGPRHAFLVESRDPDHPINKGLPSKWMHNTDELYDGLCGPAEEMTILSTAFSAKEKHGTDENEPVLMTIRYGNGRVFHTTLGHDTEAMKCVGFITTFQRGAEWAATGKVTQKVPADFPTADKPSLRQ